MLIPALTRTTELTLSHIPESYPLMRLYYGNIVEREIDLGRITRRDRVLCIGGGAFPATAIEICRRTGAAVDVLDCDPEAVKRARILLRKMGMWEIFVHYGCGKVFDPSPYTVIHVALQVRGRDQILAHLKQKTQPGARVLVRLPREGLERFYDRSCPEPGWMRGELEQRLKTQPASTMKGTCILVKEVTASDTQKNGDPHRLAAAGAAALAN